MRVCAPRFDWLSVNWRESNRDIASKLGCSTQAVHLRRHQFRRSRIQLKASGIHLPERPWTRDEVAAACAKLNDVWKWKPDAKRLSADGFAMMCLVAALREFCGMGWCQIAAFIGAHHHEVASNTGRAWQKLPSWVRLTFRDCIDVELHRARDPKFGTESLLLNDPVIAEALPGGMG